MLGAVGHLAGAGDEFSNAAIRGAIADWQQLYDGKLVVGPASEETLTARSVAVRHPDFRPDPGNWPKILHHPRPTEHVVVLIHGLVDSPGYMEPIARAFLAQGVNVVLPLMPAHGRLDPVREMRRVDHRAWRDTVDRSVEIASALGRKISIGGLSTGGALALDYCLRKPGVVLGKVYLFAAALGLTPFQRGVLATYFLPKWADAVRARGENRGIGGNPIKYSRRFLMGVRQLQHVISSIRRRLGVPLWRPFADLPQPPSLDGRVFVAHSGADTTILYRAVASLVRQDDPGQHHIVPAQLGVLHADLVLADAMTYTPRWRDEAAAPRGNPEHAEMVKKALAFLTR